MTTQPKTEQLADELENTPFQSTRYEAAAELRRLEAANAELLEALVECMADASGYEKRSGKMLVGGWPGKARAAIKKHGGAA